MTYYAKADRPVETCVVGTGGFGQSFLAQAQRVPLMNARIAVDLTAEAAAAGLKAAGIDPRKHPDLRIRERCKSRVGSGRLHRRQRSRARRRASLRCGRRSNRAPESRRPPCPACDRSRKAPCSRDEGTRQRRRTGASRPALPSEAASSTTVDGDQPSLLIGLATWAEVMGFHLIAAGKSSEYDFVFDPATRHLSSNERSADDVDLSRHWELGNEKRLGASRSPSRRDLRLPAARRARSVRAHGRRQRDRPAAGPPRSPRAPRPHR